MQLNLPHYYPAITSKRAEQLTTCATALHDQSVVDSDLPVEGFVRSAVLGVETAGVNTTEPAEDPHLAG